MLHAIFFDDIVKIVALCLTIIYMPLLKCDGMNFPFFHIKLSYYIYFYIKFYDTIILGIFQNKFCKIFCKC